LSRKTELKFTKKIQRLALAIAEKYHNVSVKIRVLKLRIWAPAYNDSRLGIFTHDQNRHFY
jgi:hypothetical protein